MDKLEKEELRHLDLGIQEFMGYDGQRGAGAIFVTNGKTIDKLNKLMTKKKESVKGNMTMDKDIVKLDRESYGRLKEMFSSNDKENHAVAFGVLENLEMLPNLPYVLLLYKLYKESTGDGWKKIIPKMESALKKNGKGKIEDVTYKALYKVIRGSYPVEDLQVLLDEFLPIIRGHIVEWGFSFLKDSEVEWKVVAKEYA